MVASNKTQSVEWSPASFSVKDAVAQHTKEKMTAPLLVVETQSEPASRNEHLDVLFSTPTKNNNKKSVRFLDDVHVHEIPVLTQEEKDDMFLNKQDIQNSSLQMKRLVIGYRTGRMPEEDKTKIGLESYLNPHMNMSIRRRMTRVVMRHQQLIRQNPSAALDEQYLAKNCTTVAKSATFLALGRAKNVLKELANDNKEN